MVVEARPSARLVGGVWFSIEYLLRMQFVSQDRAGIPARRPGNFLLSCQKKVTKEETLKTHLGKHLHRGFGW